MLCSICNTLSRPAFSAKILSKYDISYFACPECGLLQTEKPFWLEEAYRHTLNDEDTSVLQRNWYFADVASSLLFTFFDRNGKFLDFGGGHGVFTRLMRDRGFDFYWRDPNGKNIFARGFEYTAGTVPVELVTCIECFEHFAKPKKELETMLGISSNILFATQLLPSPVPNPAEWDYYGLTHGQHIAFYSLNTLRYLAEVYGLKVYSNGVNIHLLTKKNLRTIQFRKAVTPGILKRLRIKSAMGSRSQTDFEHIVRTKNKAL
jgi:hypothetical protein